MLALPHLLAAALVVHPPGPPGWAARPTDAAASILSPRPPAWRAAAAASARWPAVFRRAPSPVMAEGSSLYAEDGGEVDWDKEASRLALPTNEYVRALKTMKLPELVEEFAKTAPEPVRAAAETPTHTPF
jgi:hypothetical protein